MRVLAMFCLGVTSVAVGQVSVPLLGWIPDRTSIRTVYGIPATAAVGARIIMDQDLSRIAVSSAGDYVLVSGRKTGTVFVYTPETGLVPVKGAAAAPDLVVLSPRGSAAVLWFSSTHRAQVVTGLPNAPQIQQHDASFLESEPGGLAISDDGMWLSGVFAGAVYAFGPDGEVTRLPVESVDALTFFQGTHDMAVAAADGLKMVTGVGGFAVVSTLLAPGDAALHPIAVATTSDNRTVLFADRGGSVITLDIASGSTRTQACGCQPDGLFGMGPTTFRLTGLNDGAIKLFDVTRDEVLFAPLGLAQKAEGAAQ